MKQTILMNAPSLPLHGFKYNKSQAFKFSEVSQLASSSALGFEVSSSYNGHGPWLTVDYDLACCPYLPGDFREQNPLPSVFPLTITYNMQCILFKQAHHQRLIIRQCHDKIARFIIINFIMQVHNLFPYLIFHS